MNTERTYSIDLNAEIDRLFDDSSLPGADQPRAVILMGGVAAGKTHLRIKDYSRGYVLIDAAEMFHHLSRGEGMLDFPDAFAEPLELIGPMVADRAISERRHIVTEIIGHDIPTTVKLITALGAARVQGRCAGGHVRPQGTVQAEPESRRQHLRLLRRPVPDPLDR